MKEKIIKILESQFSVVEYEDPDTGFTESTTIDVLTTDEFPAIVGQIELLINQEVEKRIAERMPTIEDEERNVFKFSGNRSLSSSYFTGFFDACKWLRSRLAQKTEGGGE